MKLTEKAKSLGIRQDMLDTALVSAGNTARLARVMKKAQKGDAITIAAIGGSVTHGAAASVKENSYAGIVREWWEHNFPWSTISYVNAGFSGTSSLLGVHRVEEYLLRHNPDFVIVEFAVNDIINDYQQEAYASLVRRILTHESAPAVVVLFVMNNGGINAQADQMPVAAHYDLPMISYRDAVWPEVKTEQNPDGQYLWEDICADWVHPTDKGHAIVGELVTAYLNDVLEELDTLSVEEPAIPEPFRPYTYENAHWLNWRNTAPVSLGSFEQFTDEKCSWKSNGGNEPLVLEFEGKRVFLTVCTEHRENIDVTISVDGGEPYKMDSPIFWGGIYSNYLVYDADTVGKHTISITANGCELYCGGLFVS